MDCYDDLRSCFGANTVLYIMIVIEFLFGNICFEGCQDCTIVVMG